MRRCIPVKSYLAGLPPDGDEDFDTREGDTFALCEPAASESQG
jgi:hypothetical protein